MRSLTSAPPRVLSWSVAVGLLQFGESGTPKGWRTTAWEQVRADPVLGGREEIELGLGCGASGAEGLLAGAGGRLCEGSLSKAREPRKRARWGAVENGR